MNYLQEEDMIIIIRLYGHDLTFGGYGDDPKGLKSIKTTYITRYGQKWNGFSNEGTHLMKVHLEEDS